MESRPNTMTQIFGILNLTRDSFSDGGRYLAVEAALQHAQQMLADGANIIDVGAEATNANAEHVSAENEIARLTPVVTQLKARGVRVSVDTSKPAVMRHVLTLGVDFINDVTALRAAAAVAAVRDFPARLILMHSVSSAARAEPVFADPATIVERITVFFSDRIRELENAGIDRARLILDPGMGLFLGTSAEASLTVLRELSRLADLGCPILVSASRKSFIGHVLAGPDGARPVADRAAGTLAAELWAAQHGAAYIRTHEVRPLRDALRVWQAITNSSEHVHDTKRHTA